MCVQIPLKTYRMRVAAAPSAGSAAAGVTWFDISGRPLSKHVLRLEPEAVAPATATATANKTASAAGAADGPDDSGGLAGMAVVAPASAAAAAVWVGKWDRNGTLAVRSKHTSVSGR